MIKTIYLSESSSNITNTEKTIIDNCQNDCANFFNKLLDAQDDWKLHWIKMGPENQRGAIFFIVTGEVDCSDPGSRCSCVGTWCVGPFDCLIWTKSMNSQGKNLRISLKTSVLDKFIDTKSSLQKWMFTQLSISLLTKNIWWISLIEESL